MLFCYKGCSVYRDLQNVKGKPDKNIIVNRNYSKRENISYAQATIGNTIQKDHNDAINTMLNQLQPCGMQTFATTQTGNRIISKWK